MVGDSVIYEEVEGEVWDVASGLRTPTSPAGTAEDDPGGVWELGALDAKEFGKSGS